jgi:hypothetical protein
VLELEDVLLQVVIIVSEHLDEGGIGGIRTDTLPTYRFICKYNNECSDLLVSLIGNLIESAFGRWVGRTGSKVLIWPALLSGCLLYQSGT